ncbi:hypothetical protein PR003_g2067 [Phytophthora rubi]|uniref:Uncharacterized protein n=1 Tax=Phytophthora rubi TaxID=129364 RepID=A0A6A4G8M3_9STRA|nr:hypothetical protein PR003_g2067 [Phytophthora rubi]
MARDVPNADVFYSNRSAGRTAQAQQDGGHAQGRKPVNCAAGPKTTSAAARH